MNGMGESFHSEEDFEEFQPSSQPIQPQQLLLQQHQQVKVTSQQQQQQQPTPFFSSTNSNTGSTSVGQQNITSANSGSCSPVAGSNNSRPQICCLVDDGNRCHRPAGNASYSKRIQKTVYFKRLRLEIDLMAHNTYICDYHKMIIQNARTRQKRESEDETNENEANDDVPEVDLYQLQVNTLRRYKKYFKIPSRPGLNKAQLADILMRHFKTIPINEKETVTFFIYMVKQERDKLNNKEARQDGMMSGSAEFLDRY